MRIGRIITVDTVRAVLITAQLWPPATTRLLRRQRRTSLRSLLQRHLQQRINLHTVRGVTMRRAQ